MLRLTSLGTISETPPAEDGSRNRSMVGCRAPNTTMDRGSSVCAAVPMDVSQVVREEEDEDDDEGEAAKADDGEGGAKQGRT